MFTALKCNSRVIHYIQNETSDFYVSFFKEQIQAQKKSSCSHATISLYLAVSSPYFVIFLSPAKPPSFSLPRPAYPTLRHPTVFLSALTYTYPTTLTSSLLATFFLAYPYFYVPLFPSSTSVWNNVSLHTAPSDGAAAWRQNLSFKTLSYMNSS